MTYNRSLILFSVFIAFGMVCFVIARLGFYPVVLVNFKAITAAEIEKNVLVTENYFRNLSLLYGTDSGVLDKTESREELRRATLDRLISGILIYAELNKKVKDFQSIAENKIKEAISDKGNLEEGIKKIYGLTAAEFKNQVLLPQAYQEILEGRMFLENKNFEEWLKTEKKNSRVIILLSEFAWSDVSVVIRK